MPPDDLIEGYDEQWLTDFLDGLKARKKAGKRIPPTALIFDDMMGQLPLQSEAMQHLISCFRHYNLYVFFTSQYINRAIPPYLRECCNWAVMFRTLNKNSIDAMYAAFGQLFDNRDDFKHALERATRIEHHALLFHNQQDSFEKSYSTWTADKVKEFQLVKSKK